MKVALVCRSLVLRIGGWPINHAVRIFCFYTVLIWIHWMAERTSAAGLFFIFRCD